MNGGEEYLKARRRQEADLLICRLTSDWVHERKSIDWVRTSSLNKELMARDPSFVHDNLSGCPSDLWVFDLQRLRALIEQGL